jgi:hypothetical protein
MSCHLKSDHLPGRSSRRWRCPARQLLTTGARLALALCCFQAVGLGAVDEGEVQRLLDHEILGKSWAAAETQAFIESRVPRMPQVHSAAEWKTQADRLRRQVLEKVIFHGEAAKWRDARTHVEWLGNLEGGPGYKIKTLRYEALPGLWIPALLYEPEHLSGKVPVALALNGHAPEGKALGYKQIRCINQAKRGMIVLSPEFFGMGQLATEGFRHNRLSQIDLCGSSGVAPFYLAMQRGLDLLLALDHADRQRVAVSGLSGGGWQTIVISSLDTRVTLANPVAGYESFRDRAPRIGDVGDAEQAPCDLALFADYTHLTAMRAPRPTLRGLHPPDGHARPAADAPDLQRQRRLLLRGRSCSAEAAGRRAPRLRPSRQPELAPLPYQL